MPNLITKAKSTFPQANPDVQTIDPSLLQTPLQRQKSTAGSVRSNTKLFKQPVTAKMDDKVARRKA